LTTLHMKSSMGRMPFRATLPCARTGRGIWRVAGCRCPVEQLQPQESSSSSSSSSSKQQQMARARRTLPVVS